MSDGKADVRAIEDGEGRKCSPDALVVLNRGDKDGVAIHRVCGSVHEIKMKDPTAELAVHTH